MEENNGIPTDADKPKPPEGMEEDQRYMTRPLLDEGDDDGDDGDEEDDGDEDDFEDGSSDEEYYQRAADARAETATPVEDEDDGMNMIIIPPSLVLVESQPPTQVISPPVTQDTPELSNIIVAAPERQDTVATKVKLDSPEADQEGQEEEEEEEAEERMLEIPGSLNEDEDPSVPTLMETDDLNNIPEDQNQESPSSPTFPGTPVQDGEFPTSPMSHSEETVQLDLCLVCLKRFPLLQVGRKLEHSETTFLALSKTLNMQESAISNLWDYSTELVPICDLCFSFAQRIMELEMQAEIIKSELERKVDFIKKAIEESEEQRDEALTKRFNKWRKLAVKVVRPQRPAPKSKRIQRNVRVRGRPRKGQKGFGKAKGGETKKRKSNKACSVVLDSLEVAGNAVSPEVLLFSDAEDMNDDSKYSPVVSDSDSEWKSSSSTKKSKTSTPRTTAGKRKRIQRAPMKITNYVNDEDDYDEDWAPDDKKPMLDPDAEEEVEEEEDEPEEEEEEEASPPTSEEISESELTETPKRSRAKTKTKAKPKPKPKSKTTPKRKRKTRAKKSPKSAEKSTKWTVDKRRNKLYFDNYEVNYVPSADKFILECGECKHQSIGTKRDLVKGKMRKHIITQHLGTFKCDHPQCGKVYSGHKELTNHQAAAHENTRHTCDICGKPFSFETSLRRHMWSHKNAEEKEEYLATGKKKLGRPDDPCQCDQCGRSFQSSVYLKRHHRIHMNVKDRLTHMCTMCGKLFVSTSGLNYHMTSVHDRDNIDMTDWISCPHCPRRFKKRHQLKKHLPVHTGETCCQCSLCGKSFKSLSALRFHRHVHDDERANACQYCDKSFKRRHHLQRHVQIFHPGGKNLPQRPQNRLKGPGGKDGGPAAAGPSMHRVKRSKSTASSVGSASAGVSNNGHVSVITNTNTNTNTSTTQEEQPGRYSQVPLNLVNNYHNPNKELPNPIAHHHQQQMGQPGFTPTLNYEYPYDFQSLIRF